MVKRRGKLVRVVEGALFDVAVDLRRNSPTLGQWVEVCLSSENKRQVWIPEGFGHGFLATTDRAQVLHKTTKYWRPEYDRRVLWCDIRTAGSSGRWMERLSWPPRIRTRRRCVLQTSYSRTDRSADAVDPDAMATSCPTRIISRPKTP